MNTRQKGKKLENYTLETLKVTDSKSKLTKNSGAVHNNGDIEHKDYQVECKLRNTENLTINIKTWNKLCNSIKIGSSKTPLLILSNKNNLKFAVLKLSDFERIINGKK